MTLRMPVVFTEQHRGHAPDGGYWLGVHLAGDEEPERGDALLAGLGPVDRRDSSAHGDGPVLAVHDAGMVACLASAHRRWVEAGHPDDPGQPNVVPYIVPRGPVLRQATTIRAQIGWYATDTLTVLSAGTYDAARAAVDAALTAVDLVLDGAPAAYAAVRPPGHHAGPDFFGGSCYLNNAAVAARALARRGGRRVAVVDIDAHHGNGTQAVFYDDPTVMYASVHVDPAAGWYPHYCGYADETGIGPGLGANRNIPVPPGTADAGWLDALDRALDGLGVDGLGVDGLGVDGLGVGGLVVSLGVDAATDDPESPLRVSADGFAAAGARLAALGVPTVLVQEGGYDLPRLGPLVRAVLDAFEGDHRIGRAHAPSPPQRPL